MAYVKRRTGRSSDTQNATHRSAFHDLEQAIITNKHGMKAIKKRIKSLKLYVIGVYMIVDTASEYESASDSGDAIAYLERASSIFRIVADAVDADSKYLKHAIKLTENSGYRYQLDDVFNAIDSILEKNSLLTGDAAELLRSDRAWFPTKMEQAGIDESHAIWGIVSELEPLYLAHCEYRNRS